MAKGRPPPAFLTKGKGTPPPPRGGTMMGRPPPRRAPAPPPMEPDADDMGGAAPAFRRGGKVGKFK